MAIRTTRVTNSSKGEKTLKTLRPRAEKREKGSPEIDIENMDEESSISKESPEKTEDHLSATQDEPTELNQISSISSASLVLQMELNKQKYETQLIELKLKSKKIEQKKTELELLQLDLEQSQILEAQIQTELNIENLNEKICETKIKK